MPRHFTEDWFTRRIPSWEKAILPNLPPGPIAWLELGSFEGRSACWVHDSVLSSHPGSQLVCVDQWLGACAAAEARFDANAGSLPGVIKIKSSVRRFLCSQEVEISPGLPAQYNVVYVDADHQAKSALTDAALAWPLLKTGGVLVFDDYPWQHPAGVVDKLPPKEGIDAFLQCWRMECEVILRDWQIFIRKK